MNVDIKGDWRSNLIQMHPKIIKGWSTPNHIVSKLIIKTSPPPPPQTNQLPWPPLEYAPNLQIQNPIFI